MQYEGNLNSRWGNLSGEEMLRRFWLGVIAGCYVTHGETYLDPDQPFDENTTPTLWWSHGGKLHGTSPERIAFLRKLVEETAAAAGKDAKRTGLEAQPAAYYLNASTSDATGAQRRRSSTSWTTISPSTTISPCPTEPSPPSLSIPGR